MVGDRHSEFKGMFPECASERYVKDPQTGIEYGYKEVTPIYYTKLEEEY